MLAPATVLAIDTLPQFNPLCWQKGSGSGDETKDPLSCTGARQKWLGVSDSSVAEGWVKDTECGGTGDDVKWGKCLPPGKTITSIALGGKRVFYNIGEYVKTGYRIALSVAGILAAVVIIISGLQWTASGGNSEVISSAKKRIAGAAMGLVLAFGSYIILNTINPALVNLRLPQTYMIRQVGMPVYWCSEFGDPTKFSGSDDWIKRFADAGKSSAMIDKEKYNNLQDKEKGGDFSYSYNVSGAEIKGPPVCGEQYFPQGGGGLTCYGDACVGADKKPIVDQMCFPPLEQDQTEHKCYLAKMGVLLYSSRGEGGCVKEIFSGSGWEWGNGGGWTPSVWLVAVYKDGSFEKVVSGQSLSSDGSKKVQAFNINYADSVLQAPANTSGFVGFVLGISLDYACFDPNNRDRYVGKDGSDIIDFYNISQKSTYSYGDLVKDPTKSSAGVFISIDVSQINPSSKVKSKASSVDPNDKEQLIGGGLTL